MSDKLTVLTADAQSPRLDPTVVNDLGATLSDAFADDPVIRHHLRLPPLSSSSTSPPPSSPHSLGRIGIRLRPSYTSCVRYVADKSQAKTFSSSSSASTNTNNKYVIHYMSNHSCAALWMLDGAWHDKSGQFDMLIGLLRSYGTHSFKTLGLFNQLEKQHPQIDEHMDASSIPSSTDGVLKGPRHAYLWIVGTHPDAQRKGLGGRVMREMLKRLDEEGMPAYLESFKENNIAFYEKHGFELLRLVDIDDKECPPIWAMWRRPKKVGEEEGKTDAQ